MWKAELIGAIAASPGKCEKDILEEAMENERIKKRYGSKDTKTTKQEKANEPNQIVRLKCKMWECPINTAGNRVNSVLNRDFNE